MNLMRWVAGAGGLAIVVAACGQDSRTGTTQAPAAQRYVTPGGASVPSLVNIYRATGVGALSPVAARAKPLVYVPNSRSDSVTVIDPATHKVLRTFSTDKLPQHVVPSYDMSRLWVTNNEGNSLPR